MTQTSLELWLNNKKEAVKRFFEELQTVDAPAYLEIPLNEEEWKEEKDAVRKTAIVVLLTMWLNGADLKEAWEGWFYKDGYLIMIEPNGRSDVIVAIVNRKTGAAFVENYPLPKTLEPLFLIDTEGVLDEG